MSDTKAASVQSVVRDSGETVSDLIVCVMEGDWDLSELEHTAMRAVWEARGRRVLEHDEAMAVLSLIGSK